MVYFEATPQQSDVLLEALSLSTNWQMHRPGSQQCPIPFTSPALCPHHNLLLDISGSTMDDKGNIVGQEKLPSNGEVVELLKGSKKRVRNGD